MTGEIGVPMPSADPLRTPIAILVFADDRRIAGRRLRNLPEERRAIQRRLKGRLRAVVLPDARLEDVWEAFSDEEARGGVQVFHFAGHASESWLAFEDDTGAPVRADATGLAGLLQRQDSLVLVVLNGCSTHEQVRRLRRGIPAVIATTETIHDEAAACFAAELYGGLTTKPLERAFLDATDLLRAKFGDNPRGVMRELDQADTAGETRWPWILDCDDAVKGWRLGERLETAVSTLDQGEALRPRWPLLHPQPSRLPVVEVPAGRFLMGARDDEEGSWDNERPRIEMDLASFHLAQTPVTNAQYRRFVEARPEVTPPSYWGDRRYDHNEQPVVGVSWDDASAYCEWAGLSLPTEAQWEYACRAGTLTRYHGGESESDLARVAWYGDNANNRLQRVGRREPNEWGLYDMHGNVWEWCADPWVEHPTQRVLRGGSFRSIARLSRAACRVARSPSFRHVYAGFRPVLQGSAPSDPSEPSP